MQRRPKITRMDDKWVELSPSVNKYSMNCRSEIHDEGLAGKEDETHPFICSYASDVLSFKQVASKCI